MSVHSLGVLVEITNMMVSPHTRLPISEPWILVTRCVGAITPIKATYLTSKSFLVKTTPSPTSL